MRLACGDLLVVVGAPGAPAHPDLGEGDDVQGEVQLPVTTAWQAVADPVSAGDLDRHENHLVGRHGEFSRLADVLIPFLVSR